MRIFVAFLLVGLGIAAAFVLATAKLRTIHDRAGRSNGNPYALYSARAYTTTDHGPWQYPAAIVVGITGLGAGVAVGASSFKPRIVKSAGPPHE